MIEIGVHKGLQLPFALRQFSGKSPDCHARRADVSHVSDPLCPDPRACFDHIIDHHANLFAHQLAQQSFVPCAGIAINNRPQRSADKGQFAQLVERQQPCADAIVDVVIVIGDIVGNRRNLRL